MSTSSLDNTSVEEDVYPASFFQESLWFLDQLEPNKAVYNIPSTFQLAGLLNLNVLEQVLNAIVQRHETLRTSFRTLEGQLMQVISPTRFIPLQVVDLRHLSGAEQEAEVLRLATEDAQRPFDLTRGPLLRITLLQLEAEKNMLLLTMHHIISDGWSIGVLCHELAALYEAFLHDQPSPLPQLPIQYADFAVWQRQLLQGEALATQVSYWRQQLTGAPFLLELPTDHPRPAVQTFRGAQHSFVLCEELAVALKVLSRREGITLFMTLLAAFNVLLYRYTGQTDVVVGSPIANRHRPGMEGLIGFFVNTLVLRTDLAGNPSFEELLRRIRKIALEAYAHQDLPFEELVRELHPERNMSYDPLFQVMFTFQTGPTPTFDLPGLHLRVVEGRKETAKFDLSLILKDTGQGLTGSLEYNADLFEAATISRMEGHFQTLLEGIVANPGQHLSDLPLLTGAECHQLIVEWNATQTAYPKQVCIHQLFEDQVERTPEAVAVVFEGEQLTYQELNRRANQLAHHLQDLGVEPEVGVGICVERSLQMVAGLLGILKAGGAYIPLDPAYPKERLAFMLEDSQVPVLLTQQRLLKDLPEYEGRVVCLDTDWEIIAQGNEATPICEVQPANLAYVIYTSGSTGRPKGVLGTHQAAINRFNWMWERFPFEAGEICCQKTSLSFVDSLWEIFGSLLQGIQTVLIPDEVLKDPHRLLHTLAALQVTRIVLVPSLLRVLLNTDIDLQKQLPNLKYWTSSGEVLSLELLKRFQERMPQSRLINLYGSSEVAADATCCDLKNWKTLACVPIGRPIANTQVYLLDAFLQPVPIGVPGELYVGGNGVARGYLNRPELTAERFIPDPFSHEPGARLYKTGDLARYLSDGTLEFLGRLDHQVKIRGFRIELGEIEAVLSQHSEVRETVVVAREDSLGDKRLAAYIVAKPGQAPAITSLRSLLKEQLPEYMVPSAFVLLEALPLTPNGKVDRQALPLPNQVRLAAEQVYFVPYTPIEEMLAGMWSQLLNVDQVGIHDSFYGLGGHSLLAIQLMSRVRDTFQVELPLYALYENPTVAGLAKHVESAYRIKQKIQVPLPQALPRVGTLPLSFAEERLWFFDQLEPGSPVYNISAALHLKGPLDVTALHQSLNTIVQRHETLRTTFEALDGKPQRIIAPTLSLALPVVDLTMLPESERKAKTSQLAIEEAQRSFKLAQGPLVRTSLLELDWDEHTLLLTLHHIISDGWSMGVLLQELAALYNAYSSGYSSPLPALPIQYGDYALWQRIYLQEEMREEQVSYWQEQLAALAILQLPTDRPRPSIQTFRGAKYPLALSAALTKELKELSRRQGVTLFMTLLAAFNVLLYRHTEQDDLCIGTPIANRTRSELEKLIGLFVNTLALRTDLSGNPSFRELLQRVRKVALEAYAHQDLPFEQVVKAIQPKRDLGFTPLFQVMFALQNFPMEDIELACLMASQLEVDNKTAKFDVTLNLLETPEGLSGYFEYNTDLFEEATIARMTGDLQTLLAAIVARPEQRLRELPLLTEAECQQLLVERNTRLTSYPPEHVHLRLNRKVDRGVLPKGEGLRAELGTPLVAPQTEFERTITAIWQGILGIEKVGRQDNFFDLGGDSLLLVQVQSKLQTVLKRNIALLELFEYPNVSSLAEHLNQEQFALASPQGNLRRTEVRRESMKRQKQIRQQRRTMLGEQEVQAE
jgi:amino acid adenylation domain-containing protein